MDVSLAKAAQKGRLHLSVRPLRTIQRLEIRERRLDRLCLLHRRPSLSSSFWHMHLMPPCLLDPGRASKRIKHLPHKYLASYDESLYLDNTVRLRLPLAAMFAKLERGNVFKCFRHLYRQCVYDEAAEVIRTTICEQIDDRGRQPTLRVLYGAKPASDAANVAFLSCNITTLFPGVSNSTTALRT